MIFSQYAGASALLLSSAFVRTWMAIGDDDEFISAFFSSKLNQFLLINFLFSVAIFAFFAIFSYFLDETLPYQWEGANGYVKFIILDMLKPFFLMNMNLDAFNICFIFCCFWFRYLAILLRLKIDGFEYSSSNFSAKQFLKMFVFHIILIASSLYLGLFFFKYNSQNVFLYFFVSFLLDCTFGYISSLICYFTLFLEIGNINQTNNYIQIKFYSIVVTETMNILINVSLISMLEPLMLFAYFAKLPTVIFKLLMIYDNFGKWKMLLTVLNNNLVDANENDLQNENSCIICRSTMNVGNSKKLPCSHCFHPSCLQQWIINHSKCPLCQYDIAQLIQNNEQKLNVFEKYLRKFINFLKIHDDNDEQFEQEQNELIDDNIPNVEENDNKRIYRLKRSVLVFPKFDENIKEMEIISYKLHEEHRFGAIGAFLYINDDKKEKKVITIVGNDLLNFKFNKNMNLAFFVIGFNNICEIECNIIYKNIDNNIQNLPIDALIKINQEIEEQIIHLRNEFKTIIDS